MQKVRKALSVALAALMAISSVTPYFASETETAKVETQSETAAEKTTEKTEETNLDKTQETNAPETQNNTDAMQEAKETETATNDTGANQDEGNDEIDTDQYLLLLPMLDGVKYSDIDESKIYKPDETEEAVDDYTILLYEEGENVKFSVDSGMSFSVFYSDGENEFLRADEIEDGKLDFTMPADDLALQFVKEETDGKQTDVVPQTLAGAGTVAPESATPSADAEETLATIESEMKQTETIQAEQVSESEQAQVSETIAGAGTVSIESSAIESDSEIQAEALETETEAELPEMDAENETEASDEIETETGQTIFKVSAPDGKGYSMSVQGGEMHEAGEMVSVTVTPEKNYELKEVTASYDGNIASADNTNVVSYETSEESSDGAPGDAEDVGMEVKNVTSEINVAEDTKSGSDILQMKTAVSAKEITFIMPKANVVLKAKAVTLEGADNVTNAVLHSAYDETTTMDITYYNSGKAATFKMTIGKGTSAGIHLSNSHLKDNAGLGIGYVANRCVEFHLKDGTTVTTLAYCLQPPLGREQDQWATNRITALSLNNDVAKGLFYLFGGPAWGDTVNGVNIKSLVDEFVNNQGNVSAGMPATE